MSRYNQGGKTENLVNRSGWWQRSKIPTDPNESLYVINMITAGRPDAISHLFYQTDHLDWFIMQYNNIVDPTIELTSGKIIRIPTKTTAINYLSKQK